MKQISTGTGLCVLGLGIAVLGAAQLIGSKGSQAFAQIGSERRVVNMGVYNGIGYVSGSSTNLGMAYRIWSDGVIETRCVGFINQLLPAPTGYNYNSSPYYASIWAVVDNGQTPSFQPTDTNTDGSVDAADLGKVLLDYGATQQVTPAPTIDCQTSTIP